MIDCNRVETIAIALVGTGGGGKSTLANLLCGRYLLPMRVRDSLSVGFVLHHNPRTRGLVVRTGEAGFQWPASEIRARLESLAESKSYDIVGGPYVPFTIHLEVPMAVGPAGPFGSLWWKHKLLTIQGYQINNLGVAVNTPLEIRDLPGFRHSGDHDHLQAILAGIDSAVVVAIFNAEEVDNHKEVEFACEVFRRTRESGSGWPLIVLNRIDVFLRDHNPERQLQRRIDKLHRSLREVARKLVKDDVVPDFAIHTLSSLAVMAAEAIVWSDRDLSKEDRSYLLEHASRFANILLTHDDYNRLPRDPQRWSKSHVRSYHQAILRLSSYTPFLAALRDRVLCL